MNTHDLAISGLAGTSSTKITLARSMIAFWQRDILRTMLKDSEDTDITFAHKRICLWQSVIADAVQEIITGGYTKPPIDECLRERLLRV